MSDKYEIEICQWCEKPITDLHHECFEPLDENNYSDRLTKGFELIDPDGERRKD
ncbi:hypothetical protein LCGC14_1161120 [marine sediment metagenome]|uniref:Uncharacterized protein n=1 Tax=marine sediment metagenome TaxID=412755 RepID=A0A0F9PY74_9ZZZZ